MTVMLEKNCSFKSDILDKKIVFREFCPRSTVWDILLVCLICYMLLYPGDGKLWSQLENIKCFKNNGNVRKKNPLDQICLIKNCIPKVLFQVSCLLPKQTLVGRPRRWCITSVKPCTFLVVFSLWILTCELMSYSY